MRGSMGISLSLSEGTALVNALIKVCLDESVSLCQKAGSIWVGHIRGMPKKVAGSAVARRQASDNTPGRCASRCEAQGYAYAGVEYGNECHCGTGIKSGTAMAPPGDRDVPCSGNVGLTCGGSWRIQIYSSTGCTISAVI